VNVTDNTKPVFTSCPPSITPAINAAGCVATVNTLDPSVTDNCTAASQINLNWTMTGAVNASSPATGINYVGTYSFPVGVTTVAYTAMDVAGNTATCTYTVTVTNTLTGTISGTATVQQNAGSTSNITFTGSGGVRPYTFTYNVSSNGGAAGSNQTITTTGSNSVTTVPQSSSVTGQYIYTLVSVTDANGCVGLLPQTNPIAVITVISSVPDYSPIVNIDATQFATVGFDRDFIVNISELGNSVNFGQVVFRITQPSLLDITFNAASGTSSVFGGTINNNSDWNITKAGAIITCTLKTGVTLSPFGNSVIGFRATRRTGTAPNQTGGITASLINGTGGDNVNTNNTNSIVTSGQ
jgi:hypothetical protein